MFNIAKTLLSDILGATSKNLWNKNDGLRVFFQSEYKKDAQWAYEYWINTGKMNYHNS